MRALILLLLFLLACDSRRPPEKIKTLNFPEFSIQVPVAWEPVKTEKARGYITHIRMDAGDTLHFDLGWFPDPLEEEVKYRINDGDVYFRNEGASTDKTVTYDYYCNADTFDVEKFRITKARSTTIDNRHAKIVQPKVSGKGLTGIYFDSLWNTIHGVVKFQMKGMNLDPENEKQLLLAFETLHFENKSKE